MTTKRLCRVVLSALTMLVLPGLARMVTASATPTPTSTAPAPSCNVDPPTATNAVGAQQSFAVLVTAGGVPQPGVAVDCTIISGPNTWLWRSDVTGPSGDLTVSYSDTEGAGTDEIWCFGFINEEYFDCGATITWGDGSTDLAGDCNGDGAVKIDELVRAVRVASGDLPLAECEPLTTTGLVTFDDLVHAVTNALADEGGETSALTPVSSGQSTHVGLSDGTAVDLPAVSDPDGPPDTPFTRVQVSSQSSDVDLAGSELEPIGTMRVLTFEPFDPNAFANNDNLGVGRLQAADFIPTLTLPTGTLGTSDADAVMVARVGDIYVDGHLETDAVRFLPAFYDDAGNLQVRDIYFPQSILSDLEERAATALFYRAAVMRPRRVRYVPASLLTSLNWSKEPKLVRMIPKASSTANRVPLDTLAQIDPEQAQTELRRCVNNIVVLVHGHNEEEKGGFLPPNIEAPWDYAYKRDVWTLFYDHVLKNDPKARLGCTAFYEFIYPSYRPVITPYGGVKRLDEGFAEELAKQLKPFLDSGDDYRLYVVAHSMGGIVSRAGVQVMDAKLDGWLKKLVTWGSPHMGSALPSLAFALAAAPPYALHTPPGWTAAGIDISGVDALYELLIEGISSVHLPAPGPREYRWARSSTSTPHEINLDNVLDLSEAQQANDVLRRRFNFTDGSWLYNDNLRLLNANDRHVHDGKYATLFGVTTKRPTWKKTAFGYISYPDPSSTTQTGIGAYAIELLMDATPQVVGQNSNDSDGAVPVASMIASGVVDFLDIYNLGDVDHEEYYGAPDATGAFIESGKATYTAQTTLAALKVLSDDVACPSFTFTKEPPLSFGPTDTVEIVGALVWPGDQTPGSRLATLTVEADNIGQLAVLTFTADGTFSGSFPASGLPISTNFTLTLLAKLKDNTELKKTWIRGVAVPIVSYFRGGAGWYMTTQGDQGTWIEIGGSGFGTTMLPSSSVAFGGVKADVQMYNGHPYWSDTSIQAMVPFVGKGVVPVTVTVGGVTSAPRDFTVTDTWADTLQSSIRATAKCWQSVVDVPITWSGFAFAGKVRTPYNTTTTSGWAEVELKGTIDRNTKMLTKLEARSYSQYQYSYGGSQRNELDFVYQNAPTSEHGLFAYGAGAFTYLESYREFWESIDSHGVVSSYTKTKADLEATPGLPPLMEVSLSFNNE